MNYIKHSAIKFSQQNHLYGREVTFKRLTIVARQNGYILKTYSSSASLIILLNIYDRAKKSASVSLTDNNGNTYIFIDDKLPPAKQLFALAHEIGHITLEHTNEPDKSRRQEREANLFAHYLLNTTYQNLKTYTKIISVCLCFCIAVAALVYVNKSSPEPMATERSVSKNENNTVCYFTEYGNVYHLYRDCSYLKNSKKVFTSTIAKCGKEHLCSRCADRNS